MEALSFPSRSHLLSASPKIRKLKLKFNHKISYPPKPKPPIPLSRISNFAFIKCSAHSHNHAHDHHDDHHGHDHDHRHNHPEAHDHHHHHHSHHCHGLGGCDDTLTKSQQAFLRFAEAVKWSDLANFLREHLELCCCAAALFVAAGACPYLLPSHAVKPVQHAFTTIAFPLVGVSASFDAAFDIVGGKINIHVLMAMAAFASVFMGNILEGGLLLAMFNLAHIAEEYFTSRSMIDVKELKENHPDFALVLNVENGNNPSFSDLKYHEVPVNDLKVGAYILVKAGEVCVITLWFIMDYFSRISLYALVYFVGHHCFVNYGAYPMINHASLLAFKLQF